MNTGNDSFAGRHHTGFFATMIDEALAPFSKVIPAVFVGALCLVCFGLGMLAYHTAIASGDNSRYEISKEALSDSIRSLYRENMQLRERINANKDVNSLRSDLRFWKEAASLEAKFADDRIARLTLKQKQLSDANNSLQKKNEELTQINETLVNGMSVLIGRTRGISDEKQ